MATPQTDDKKKKVQQPQKVNLYNSSVTTHGDKVTNTYHAPEYTTRTETKMSGFVNPDGTPNAAAQAEFEQGKQRLAAANNIDPNTGKVDKRYLSDIFGFDPDESRQRREDEEALNRRKAKEAAWTNAVSTLGDMVSAAVGGNVWKRDMLNHGQQATEANKALWREQQAEDAKLAAHKNAIENSYADQVQKLHDAVSKAYGTSVSQTKKEGGNTRSITSQGNDKTFGYRQEQPRGVNGFGNGASARAGAGSGKGGEATLKVQLRNGTTADITMPKKKYDAMGHYLSALYNSLQNLGNDKIGKILSEHGIEPIETGKGKYTYNVEDLMSSGIVFKDSQVRNEFVKAIANDPYIPKAQKEYIVNNMQIYGGSPSEAIVKKVMEFLGYTSDKAAEVAKNQQANQSSTQQTQPAGSGRVTNSQYNPTDRNASR